jgi:Lrp/AsnC family transcriptional regulator, leucine-responsive regulatory protein
MMKLPFQLDEFDLRLLDALQENNQRTSDELADLVHLSPPSCLRRARRLRQSGVISADVSIVSPNVIGPRVTMIVLISFEREKHHLIDSFKAYVRSNAHITQCYCVAGAADFVMMVSVRDVAEYEDFTRRFFRENQHVNRYETLVATSCVKFDVNVRASLAFGLHRRGAADEHREVPTPPHSGVERLHASG